MDTGTHFIFGISLAGLSVIDQTVASCPILSEAVLFGALIGSQAPDFDSVSRLIGTKTYVKYHRGITHSMPAIFIWPTIITYVLNIFFSVSFFHLWLWTFIAVFLHVFFDVLNSYGTQAFLPFSSRWVALDIINIFDPFIFTTHSTAIILWSLKLLDPLIIFSITYLFTFIYILIRIIAHRNSLKTVNLTYCLKGNITLLPTVQWSLWNIIEEFPNKYNIGILKDNVLTWLDIKEKDKDNLAICASKTAEKVKTFLYFSNYAYPESKKTPYGYEVRWVDLRYRYNNHYPFLAIVLLDESYNVIDSYIGWVYNKKQFDKKLHSMLVGEKA